VRTTVPGRPERFPTLVAATGAVVRRPRGGGGREDRENLATTDAADPEREPRAVGVPPERAVLERCCPTAGSHPDA